MADGSTVSRRSSRCFRRRRMARSRMPRGNCWAALPPPPKHWAAEAREKVWEIALRWRNAPLSLTLAEDRKLAGKCLDDICALFRAAPEVDGG